MKKVLLTLSAVSLLAASGAFADTKIKGSGVVDTSTTIGTIDQKNRMGHDNRNELIGGSITDNAKVGGHVQTRTYISGPVVQKNVMGHDNVNEMITGSVADAKVNGHLHSRVRVGSAYQQNLGGHDNENKATLGSATK